ncbi:hypothetical protein [Novosphingobium guangzhouense]|uniref:DUF4089 domain-containing protein n=1 Tax=Novosphingobium guangzhouense TaxID=1850347 RepID=A0A2K2G5K1_9SPHN|nr:hypothetical protein [Novosphingobium guangzhouense]PNU06316.1 hypothetical protein A8V01_01825 [Novosphingobium guangzhouense]
MAETPVCPRPEASPEVPLGEAEIAAAAYAREITIPAECAPGVAANLALLARHLRTMRGEPA